MGTLSVICYDCDMKKIEIQNHTITIDMSNKGGDYISLTDIARYKNHDEPKDVVKNWMRNRFTIEFLGLWEKINNPNFKGVDFDPFKNEAGSNSFTPSPEKWIRVTQAVSSTYYILSASYFPSLK